MATNDTISLAAVTKNIIVEQGATQEIPFTIRRGGLNLDMSNFTDIRLQVRRTFPSTSWIINATLANGKMVWVNQAMGQFSLVLVPADTMSIQFRTDEEEEISAVFDVELQDDTGDVYKCCKGSFTIRREVTR